MRAYFTIMVLVRLPGKRTFGELTPPDMVVVQSVSEARQGARTGGDDSVAEGLIV